MKLIAGIDGGGTKTTLLWKYVDEDTDDKMKKAIML